MGVSETGGTVFCIGNNDVSMTGIFFLDADSMAHVNFMGTVTVDMGSELSKALLAACGPSEAIGAIQTIQGYTDQTAWLWICLPESARAHAPFSRCTLCPTAFLDRTIQTGRLPAGRTHMLTRLTVPAHPPG